MRLYEFYQDGDELLAGWEGMPSLLIFLHFSGNTMILGLATSLHKVGSTPIQTQEYFQIKSIGFTPTPNPIL